MHPKWQGAESAAGFAFDALVSIFGGPFLRRMPLHSPPLTKVILVRQIQN